MNYIQNLKGSEKVRKRKACLIFTSCGQLNNLNDCVEIMRLLYLHKLGIVQFMSYFYTICIQVVDINQTSGFPFIKGCESLTNANKYTTVMEIFLKQFAQQSLLFSGNWIKQRGMNVLSPFPIVNTS